MGVSLTAIRIYADVNGLVNGPKTPGRTAVVHDTLCSLRDLASAGIVLREGLALIAVDASAESEDLEGHRTTEYDLVNDWWVVEFDEEGVRYAAAGDRTAVTEFKCVSCKEPRHGSDQVERPQAGRHPPILAARQFMLRSPAQSTVRSDHRCVPADRGWAADSVSVDQLLVARFEAISKTGVSHLVDCMILADQSNAMLLKVRPRCGGR
jgi:hypothetical protein